MQHKYRPYRPDAFQRAIGRAGAANVVRQTALIVCAILFALLRPAHASDETPSAIEYGARSDGHGSVLFNGLDPRNTPSAVAVAGNGDIWFRESFSWHPRIARIDADGPLHEFWDPLFDYRNGQGSQGIPLGAFTASGDELLIGPVEDGPTGARIRAIDHRGDLGWRSATGCFAAGLSYACFPSRRGDPRAALEPLHPNWVTRGPRGDLWFTSDRDSLIGRIGERHALTIFTRGLTRWDSGPQFITTGPDGNMWFTEIRDRIGRITQDGRIREFSTGIPRRASLGGIVAARDGNLWFTLYHGMVLGRITVNGRVTLYHDLVYPSDGHDFDPVAMIVRDRAGHLIYNEGQAGRIARVTLSPRR